MDQINVCHFLICLLKMMSYKLYPPIPWGPEAQSALQVETLGSEGPSTPTALSAENPQTPYHLNVVQAKRQGLKAKEQTFKKKYEKYTKILGRLMWLNACLSGISIATGISSIATFATFIGIPVSTALGAASMTGVIASGIISVLTKKYQQKLKKVTKLIDIVTPALAVFERVVSKSLNDGVIDEEEFNTLQALHLETLNQVTGIDRRMEVEYRSLVEKSLLEEINELKKSRNKSLIACSLCYFVCYFKNG